MNSNQSDSLNPRSANPFKFPACDWNRIRMVPRQINHKELKQRINAARGDTIYSVVHIPVEKATKTASTAV